MSRKWRETTIDGQAYRVTQFGATEGLRVWTKLAKLIGPSIGKAFGGVKGGTALLDADVDPRAIGEAVEILVDQLDETEVVDFAKRLLAFTMIDGREVNFEIDFQGRMLVMLKVLQFVIEVNYSDFFDALGGRLARVAGAGNDLGLVDQENQATA